MKHSSKIYRNIKGVRYEQLTHNPDLFAELIAESKAMGLKYRMINNGTELIREVKNDKK